MNLNTLSHPMWVRGLKHLYLLSRFFLLSVAPYVGAWIETVHITVDPLPV